MDKVFEGNNISKFVAVLFMILRCLLNMIYITRNYFNFIKYIEITLQRI